MHIVIDVAAYYDWEPMEGTPEEADILALRAKPTQNGQWLSKVLVKNPSHTTINMPESAIQDCMAHFERIGAPKSRARTVAWYLEEKVMPHHAHPDHFLKVSVHDEPEIEAALNKYFETDGQ